MVKLDDQSDNFILNLYIMKLNIMSLILNLYNSCKLNIDSLVMMLIIR